MSHNSAISTRPGLRALGVAGWVVAGVAGWVAISGSRPTRGDIEARSIRLLDATGATRVVLMTSEDGQARIVLRDGRGVDRLALRAHADGEAAVDLLENGRLRASLEARPTGEAGLWLRDGTQTTRSSLTTTRDGVDLDLRSTSGSIHLGANTREAHRIDIRDGDGRVVASVGAPGDDATHQTATPHGRSVRALMPILPLAP